MDAGSAPDKEVNAEQPKDTTSAAKPAATDAKDKNAAKKPAANAKPGYSPILDAEIEMIGVSNKAHKKTRNVIQVLYVKAGGNAMV